MKQYNEFQPNSKPLLFLQPDFFVISGQADPNCIVIGL